MATGEFTIPQDIWERYFKKTYLKNKAVVVYRIVNVMEDCMYIGVTNNPRLRMADHAITGKLWLGDRIEMMSNEVSREEGNRLEEAFLEQYRNEHDGMNPPRNRTKDGK